MKYIVLLRDSYAVMHTELELREFVQSRILDAKFENGLSALASGFKAGRMLGPLEIAIVPVTNDCIVPVKQEVEAVTKTTKWVLPTVETKPEKKWRLATNDDAGRQVVCFGTRGSHPGLRPEDWKWDVLRGVVGSGRGQRVFVKTNDTGNIIEAAEAWIYE